MLIAKSIWNKYDQWIVLAIGLTYFITLAAPEITWINTDSDGGIYLYAAKHLTLSHPTGAPLYNIINAIALRIIPFGDEFWRLSALSAIFSSTTLFLIYRHSKSFFSVLIFLSSLIIVSQSTIVDSYALATLLMVAFYLNRHNPKVASIYGALGIATHHLSLFIIIPVVLVENRKLIRHYWPILLGLLFYLYVPIVAMINPHPSFEFDAYDISEYVHYFFSQGKLLGGLSIPSEDFVERLQEFIFLNIIGASLVIVFIKFVGKRYNSVLFCISMLMVYYFTNASPLTYVYLMPAWAFIAMIIPSAMVNTLYKLDLSFHKFASRVIAIILLTFVVLNFNYMDIGRTLDPSPTTATLYMNEVNSIPESSVIWHEGRGWEGVFGWLLERDIKGLSRGITGDDSDLIPQMIKARDEGKLYKTNVGNSLLYETHAENISSYTDQQIYDIIDYKATGSEYQLDWNNFYNTQLLIVSGGYEILRWGTFEISQTDAMFWIVVWGIPFSFLTMADKNKWFSKNKHKQGHKHFSSLGSDGICVHDSHQYERKAIALAISIPFLIAGWAMMLMIDRI